MQQPVFVVAVAACTLPASAQFDANNVEMLAHLDLPSLGASSGNDCWGYVSPSGREYALMGINNALVVVEITNPSVPVVVDTVPHTDCLTGDIKVYMHHAYVSNDCGGGIDVVDLSNVDAGVVSHVRSVTTGGLLGSHNLGIDTVSGFLYLAAPNINDGRLVAFDLSDPSDPQLAGQMSAADGGDTLHDLQAVTYDSGPWIGRQIVFGFSGGFGLDVIDVTDKSDMQRMSRTPYPNVGYCHQGWLDETRTYMYLNDEFDEIKGDTNGVTRTIIMNVSDLEDPTYVGSFTSGAEATDHNLYVHNGFIYEANYTSGLRIFEMEDPENPTEVGFFDTWPGGDPVGFGGAWSVYPFFPSGTIIVSDINSGLFVLDADVDDGPCPADWNESGILNSADVLAYIGDYNRVRSGGAPLHRDPDLADPIGTLNSSDLLAFIGMYVDGCP